MPESEGAAYVLEHYEDGHVVRTHLWEQKAEIGPELLRHPGLLAHTIQMLVANTGTNVPGTPGEQRIILIVETEYTPKEQQ